MTGGKDWMPSARHKQLDMANAWLDMLAAGASSAGTFAGSNAEAWSVPASVVLELKNLITGATGALAAITEKETRTEVTTAAAGTAFSKLTAHMRDIKRRYFYTPPLTEANLVALGLHAHDASHTPTHAPTAEVTVETFLKGRHQLGINIVYLTGSATDAANKGYRVWYRVVAPGEAAPQTPDDLHKSFYTKKKKDMVDFEYADSGKTAWMAVQVENDGKKGPWGPMVSALIP
jgi:hypothetical protein